MIENTAPTTGQAIANLLGCGIGAVQKRFEAVRAARFPEKGWDDTWKWNPVNPLPDGATELIFRSFLDPTIEKVLPLLGFAEMAKERDRFADLEKDLQMERRQHNRMAHDFSDLGKRLVRFAELEKENATLKVRFSQDGKSFAELGKQHQDLQFRFADLEKQNQILSQNGKTNDATFADLGKQKAAFAKLEKDFAELAKERNTFAESAKRFPILEKDFADLGKRFADLEKETVELRQIRKTGGAAFADLGKDYDSLQGRFADLEKENQQLARKTGDFEALRARFADLEKENAVWKARFADLEKGNLSFADSAKQESERLVKELMQYKEAEALYRKTIREQESENHTFYETKSRLEHEIRVVREKRSFS